MKYDVITFGSAILDVFIKSPEIKVGKAKEVYTPEALLLPYGVKVDVSDLTICSGGGGTNTAVGFSRLGLRTAVVARCGWDFAGRVVRQEIKKEGVYDDLLIQLEGEKTDYSTIIRGPDGDKTILVWRGGTRLEKSLINFKKLNSFWFYIASLEGNLDLLAELVDYACKNHIKVALNPGLREIEQKTALLEIARKVDVFIVNKEEAQRLVGMDRLYLPSTIAVVTDGRNGAMACVPQRGCLIMDIIPTKLVDSTGAGDAFGSGLVAGLAKGWGAEKALKLGIANGGSVVAKVGAKAGLIKEVELDYWLSQKVSSKWGER